MRKSLEQIAPELRVTCSFSAIARAYDKGFSQNANYVKGWGENFVPWHKKFKSTEPLYHVENAQGSRHDLCLLAAPAFYMNHLTCLEYMDTKLRLPKKKDNILMQNLFKLMHCEEMIALSCLLMIVHLSVCLSMCWLAAKTSQLAEYNWGPVNMGLVLDVFDSKIDELLHQPKLVLSKTFMMNMFKQFENGSSSIQRVLSTSVCPKKCQPNFSSLWGKDHSAC